MRIRLAAAMVAGLLAAAGAGRSARGADRLVVPLTGEWDFQKNSPPGDAPAQAGAWEKVTVPHCWNALDGEDGGNNYFRGLCTYRRHVQIGPELAGKTLYLRFDGAFQRTTVWVNGTQVGKHAGGFAAFVFDVTSALKPGDNIITAAVTNSEDRNVPPFSADFTFFGGIYRPVELLAVNSVHISPLEDGSPGVYLSTPQVSKTAATVTVRSLVRNAGDAAAHRSVETTVLDAAGNSVASARHDLDVAAGKTDADNVSLTLSNPHLWNGRPDPYLYSVRVRVLQNGDVMDEVTQPLGLRTFAVDPVRGFLLNGQPCDLHGACRHQDRQDKGWAISEDDQRQDMDIIKEMGCTALRLAHYQQSDFFYSLCDRAGIIVWAEVPVVDRLTNSPQFMENWQQQYRELIRQNMNHPAIMFWSAGNEVDPPENGRPGIDVYGAFRQRSGEAHALDPSRLTAAAWRERFYPPADVTDVFGLNAYLGWYDRDFSQLESYIQEHSKDGAKGKWAMTEYGAGASIYFHSEHPVRMDHSEEYQCLFHEQYWKVLSGHPEIWGKFVWNMFDFAVDSRKEGDHAGRNDKGLVTYDRTTRKDAFYFYKANWSKEPVMHINDKRFTVRGQDHVAVKVYANVPKVWLWVNNQEIGPQSDNGFKTFVWENVPLQPGKNEIRVASGEVKSDILEEDTCEWTYTPGAPTEVDVAQDAAMAAELKKGPPRAPAGK